MTTRKIAWQSLFCCYVGLSLPSQVRPAAMSYYLVMFFQDSSFPFVFSFSNESFAFAFAPHRHCAQLAICNAQHCKGATRPWQSLLVICVDFVQRDCFAFARNDIKPSLQTRATGVTISPKRQNYAFFFNVGITPASTFQIVALSLLASNPLSAYASVFAIATTFATCV